MSCIQNSEVNIRIVVPVVEFVDEVVGILIVVGMLVLRIMMTDDFCQPVKRYL